MLWKKASERNVDFALFCSLEVMGERDLGKIKITYIVASKDNINLTQSFLLLNNCKMTNLKILGFFVLLSLTLTLEINSHQAPASNQVSKDALRTWFTLKQLKPLLLSGELSKIQLKALEAALIENLYLVKKTIKAVETAKPKPAEETKPKPANKTQAKPSGKKDTHIPKPNVDKHIPAQKSQGKAKANEPAGNTKVKPNPSKTDNKTPSGSKVAPADTKTHKNGNKAPSGTKVPPIQTKPSKPENKTSGSKSTTQSKTGGSSKVETPKNKTSASGNKSTTPSGKTPAVETKHKNHNNKTKPQEKKPIVHPPHSKDHSKKVHTEDDSSSSSSTEEQTAVEHNLNKSNPNAIAPRSYTPRSYTPKK